MCADGIVERQRSVGDELQGDRPGDHLGDAGDAEAIATRRPARARWAPSSSSTSWSWRSSSPRTRGSVVPAAGARCSASCGRRTTRRGRVRRRCSRPRRRRSRRSRAGGPAGTRRRVPTRPADGMASVPGVAARTEVVGASDGRRRRRVVTPRRAPSRAQRPTPAVSSPGSTAGASARCLRCGERARGGARRSTHRDEQGRHDGRVALRPRRNHGSTSSREFAAIPPHPRRCGQGDSTARATRSVPKAVRMAR